MKSFLQRFGSLVLGVLHGFDRLRLRGSKRLLCNPGGVFSFLAQGPVPLKEYKAYAKETTLALSRSLRDTRSGRNPVHAGGGPAAWVSPGLPVTAPALCSWSSSARKEARQPALSAGMRNARSIWLLG